MTLTVDAESFLTTGTLGEIRVGATLTDIGSVWGSPQDVADASQVLIWRYGFIELSFLKSGGVHRLRLIAAYFRSGAVLTTSDSPIVFSGAWPNCGDTLSQFTQYLKSRRIDFEPVPALTSETQSAIRTRCGVCVLFGFHDGACVIDSIQFSG